MQESRANEPYFSDMPTLCAVADERATRDLPLVGGTDPCTARDGRWLRWALEPSLPEEFLDDPNEHYEALQALSEKKVIQPDDASITSPSFSDFDWERRCIPVPAPCGAVQSADEQN